MGTFKVCILFLRAMLLPKARLAFENLALRQQVAVYGRLRFLHGSYRHVPRSLCLLVLSHDRRKIVHFNITSNPYAEWAGQQIIEAFPYDEAPRYLLRDNDGIYGDDFTTRVDSMGIEEEFGKSVR